MPFDPTEALMRQATTVDLGYKPQPIDKQLYFKQYGIPVPQQAPEPQGPGIWEWLFGGSGAKEKPKESPYDRFARMAREGIPRSK